MFKIKSYFDGFRLKSLIENVLLLANFILVHY